MERGPSLIDELTFSAGANLATALADRASAPRAVLFGATTSTLATLP